MKICSNCKELKNLNEYFKHKSNKDKLQYWCKICNSNRNEYHRQYKYNRRRTDIQFRLSEALRVRLGQAMYKNTKIGSAVRDLCCSLDDFKWWLEFWFEEGMTWENHGLREGQWSIDHIIPLSKFDLTNSEEFKKACHYINLQPMWHSENIRHYNNDKTK
jgi:hypothetical protein